MAKRIRSLSSFYIPSLDKVLNFNDEIDIEDEKLVETLKDQGLIDVLIPEETKKPKRRQTKKVQTEDQTQEEDK
ncbi:hypothetical protein [Staphylococcus equorum]|uniref:Uncharacterized protein n=1 Tax=Staphylococcus equorum TaxID=246432 RepID=A0A9X4LGG7_9STAP|nr:hypothetical protein [Staphylococcus equorum]MDG0860320.1 hypothetical protein [Staphylococcus equorum]